MRGFHYRSARALDNRRQRALQRLILGGVYTHTHTHRARTHTRPVFLANRRHRTLQRLLLGACTPT